MLVLLCRDLSRFLAIALDEPPRTLAPLTAARSLSTRSSADILTHLPSSILNPGSQDCLVPDLPA